MQTRLILSKSAPILNNIEFALNAELLDVIRPRTNLFSAREVTNNLLIDRRVLRLATTNNESIYGVTAEVNHMFYATVFIYTNSLHVFAIAIISRILDLLAKYANTILDINLITQILRSFNLYIHRYSELQQMISILTNIEDLYVYVGEFGRFFIINC